ncbi:MAG: hypothetical protein GY951_02180, partial [Psychromonas sp.]|nr:hypothetical protein [Psychromonas sp.]
MKYNLLKTMLTIPRHLIVISCLSLVLLTACGGSDSSNSPTSVPDPTETVSILTMAGENGAISASSSVDVGLDKTVVIMPDIGFVVFDVLIDSVSVGPIKVYEFSNVTTAHTVEAIFIEDDSNASMYKMAVGVPEPSIDFRQEKPPRPSDWSIEVPGYYYIDMVNGSKDQEYGTPTSPRKYLPTRLTESAYIEIEGDYDHGFKLNNAVILNYDGTDDSNWVAGISGPVWITKARGKSAAFTKVKIVLKGSNIFLTNMVFKEGARPQVGSPTAGYPAKNVLIRDIDVTGGIGILGSNAGSGSDSVVVYNSIFHDAGDIDADYDQDAHVVSINGFVSNVWLLSNTMHSASGAGMQIQAGFNNSHTTHNIYVADNEIFNVRQSGLWLKSGKNIVISSNYVHDIIDTPWSVSKGIGAQYEPDG